LVNLDTLPVFPYPNVDTQLGPSVQFAAVVLVNECVSQAPANSARTFCYNLLSQNRWNNHTFSELLRIFLVRAWNMTQRGTYRSMDGALRETASSLLATYTAHLVYEFPELQQYLPEAVIRAASQNAPLFLDIQNESHSMNPVWNHPHPHQQPQYPGVPAGHPNAPYPSQQPAPQYLDPHGRPLPPGVIMGADGRYYQVAPQQPGYPPQMQPTGPSRTAGSTGRFGFQETSAPPADRFSGDSGFSDHRAFVDQGRWFSKAAPPPPQSQETQPVKESTPVDTIKLFMDRPQGIEDMDRSRHELAILGKQSGLEMTSRFDSFRQSVNDLPDLKIIDTSEASATTLSDLSLETGIGRIRVLRRSMGKQPDSVFRWTLVVPHVIVTEAEIDAIFKSLFSVPDFRHVAKAMGEYRTLLLSEVHDDEDEALETLGVLENINTFLTQRINDILKFDMRYDSLSIDSFFEDYAEICKYPMRREGRPGQDFWDDLMKNMALRVCSLDYQKYFDTLEPVELEAEQKSAGIPVWYSVTMIPLTRSAIGYPVFEGIRTVSKNTSPILWKIVDSLYRKADGTPVDTVADMHIIVTEDDVRYQVARSIRDGGQYLIKQI